MVSFPLNPYSLDSHIKYYPPPLGENFIFLVIKMSSIVKLSVIVHCMLQLHCKCINFSLHLFRSQRVIYTELSLSIKKKGRVFLIGPRKSKISLTQICFTFPHFTWPTLLCTIIIIFSEQRRLPGFRSISSVQFFFELEFIYLVNF